MKNLALVAKYPCSREHLIKVFCNVDYLKTKYELLGFSNFKILNVVDEAHIFEISYKYDVNSLPAALTKILNLQKLTTITCQYQVNRLSGSGSMAVHIPTLKKLIAQCEIVFEEDHNVKNAVNQKMNWRIVSNMAVIGSIIEKIISADIKKNTDEEVALIKTILHQF